MDYSKQIYQKILDADVITIYGHEHPDGDCYGCQIGLRELLKSNFPKKKVYAVGSGWKEFHPYLGDMDQIDDKEIASSLAILVDVSCLRRVEDHRVYLAKEAIKFDHHCINEHSEWFDGLYIVDEHCIAAAELIIDFILERGWKWNEKSANAFYLGLMTDSGNFRYQGTTKHTLELANKMVEFGAKPEFLEKIAYWEDDQTKEFKAYLRSKIKVEGNVAYASFSYADCQDRNYSIEKASSLVNTIGETLDTPIYALFAEQENGEIRVELRSNHGYPVQPTAKKYGGGGHRYAAGLSLYPNGAKSSALLADLNSVQSDIME